MPENVNSSREKEKKTSKSTYAAVVVVVVWRYNIVSIHNTTILINTNEK